MKISQRAKRVYAGMAVMDEKHGKHWVFKVDPATLSMGSTCHCVIGQVYGDTQWWNLDDCAQEFSSAYEAGAHAMGLDADDQVACGFDAPWFFSSGEYAALTRIWAYAIRRLRVLRGGDES